MNENNIIEKTIVLMHQAEAKKIREGEIKKNFVLSALKLSLGNELYDRYFPILNILIDTFVSISKKELILKLQETQKACLPLFSSCIS